jgi:hypothetical protein
LDLGPNNLEKGFVCLERRINTKSSQYIKPTQSLSLDLKILGGGGMERMVHSLDQENLWIFSSMWGIYAPPKTIVFNGSFFHTLFLLLV